MKTLFKPLLVALLASLVLPAVADDQKPHVVLVCGTTHYSPELTMPVFAEELMSSADSKRSAWSWSVKAMRSEEDEEQVARSRSAGRAPALVIFFRGCL